MATGRIGTTPVLTTRWSKAPSAGTTSLSGLDDNSVSLVYSVGYEAVYQNGVLLSRGNDYTATNGTSITLTTATVAGDIIEVFANQTIPLTDTYSQTVSDGRFIKNTLTTTTGDIIYASAANTPARLAIGSTDQVLKVSGGIPAWGAAGLTVIATGTLSGTSVVISSIPATYKHLIVSVYGATWDSANDTMMLRYNSVTTNYTKSCYGHNGTTAANQGSTTLTGWELNEGAADWLRTGGANHANWIIYDYTNTTGLINATGVVSFVNTSSAYAESNSTLSNQATAAAITSLTIRLSGGRNMTAGTYTVYGVA